MIRFYDWSFVSGLEASFPTCNSNSKLGFWDRCFDSEKSVESGNLRFISGKEISIQKQNLEPGNEPSNLILIADWKLSFDSGKKTSIAERNLRSSKPRIYLTKKRMALMCFSTLQYTWQFLQIILLQCE